MAPSPSSAAADPIRAVFDPSLTAVLHDLAPLVYSAGGSPEHDVPPHVRAASSVRRRGDRLVIVQDDVNVLVLHHRALDQATTTGAVLLPAGEGGQRSFDQDRGNKHAKLDLEACAALPDGRLVAFGSGSTPARERLVVFGEAESVRVVEAPDFYARLRSEAHFAGSELNVEGALVVGDGLRLFQRGNGAPARGLSPLNATLDLPLAEFLRWLESGSGLPVLEHILQYDLGHAEGVPFTFTDAALMSNESVAFVACAEASPDTYRDGEVLGCRFGIIDPSGVRVCPVVDPDGRPTRLKLEGIESRPESETCFDVVADMDRPDEPALWGRLEISLD